MAGVRTVVLVLCAGLVAVLLGGCGDGGEPGDATRAIADLLRQRSAAVRDGDEAAYLGTVDPRSGPYRQQQRTAFRNLDALPLAAWTQRLDDPARDTVPATADRTTADVRLTYRLRGYDTGDATAGQRLEFVRRDSRWYVAGPAPGSRPQPWDQGPLAVVRGTRSLVLGAGHPEARLRDIAAVADRAVPDVSAAWGGAWARRVVVLVPASQAAMGELLGAGPTAYAGVAAVTTGRHRDRTPADRVVVNPEAYDTLGTLGRRIVLTHETVHVATRADTSPATPLWLSEGFADWVAFRSADRDPRLGAPELARAVTAGRLPQDLPAAADFTTGGGDRVAVAYGEAWLAARMVADEWTPDRLVALYRAVGGAESREKAVGPALRAELGVSLGEFTARWRTYLDHELG
ncbi:hypothetical protein [Streptomyces sp. CMB-StM0423]|uniref:hypothetical protein n=1 Tax=Streptomyces sp. CMB-StM0423 TaxID=2059884 RepID=UPI000C6FD8BD|nr:hypothetical protein [Streptomyces sp. CMB-StM0423]AUH43468.1 hypothetical protein CXR04_27820 [Streptomyces sp. CMB-StM0423]